MLSVSYSQFKTFKDCRRLWWFENVIRMPAGQPGYELTFGNVLHAVVERWLRAGIDGRDESGKTVDLYPAGWQFVVDRGRVARIKPEDESIVQGLVDLAIERGLLERLPGRQVERPFGGLLIHGGGTFGPHVVITGRIDLLVPPATVTDHKTTASRDWKNSVVEDPDSPRYVGADEQLLLYCKILAVEYPEQQEFVVSHIIYNRTRMDVQRRQATVTRSAVEAAWVKAVETAAPMESVSSAGLGEDDFKTVDGAMGSDNEDPCSRYGGCRFLQICSGEETPEKFRFRHLRLALPDEQLIEQEKPMDLSLLARLTALDNQNTQNMAESQPAATPLHGDEGRVGEGATSPPAAHSDDWFPPTCAACNGSGKNTAGGYCVCPLGTRAFAEDKKAPKPDPTAAEPVGSSVVPTVLAAAPSTAATSDTVSAKKRGRPKKALVPEVVASLNFAPIEPLLAADFTKVPDQRAVDEPKVLIASVVRGPRILHNCVLIRSDKVRPVETTASVLRYAVEVIGGSKLEDYYKQDVWKRRDKLKEIGKTLAEKMDGVYIQAAGADGDEAALIAAISPYSSVEIGARA